MFERQEIRGSKEIFVVTGVYILFVFWCVFFYFVFYFCLFAYSGFFWGAAAGARGGYGGIERWAELGCMMNSQRLNKEAKFKNKTIKVKNVKQKKKNLQSNYYYTLIWIIFSLRCTFLCGFTLSTICIFWTICLVLFSALRSHLAKI